MVVPARFLTSMCFHDSFFDAMNLVVKDAPFYTTIIIRSFYIVHTLALYSISRDLHCQSEFTIYIALLKVTL